MTPKLTHEEEVELVRNACKYSDEYRSKLMHYIYIQYDYLIRSLYNKHILPSYPSILFNDIKNKFLLKKIGEPLLIHKGLCGWNGDCSKLITFLYRMCENFMIDEFRKNEREKRIEGQTYNEDSEDQENNLEINPKLPPQNFVEEEKNIINNVDAEPIGKCIRKAFLELNPDYRKLIKMFSQKMSTEEIMITLALSTRDNYNHKKKRAVDALIISSRNNIKNEFGITKILSEEGLIKFLKEKGLFNE